MKPQYKHLQNEFLLFLEILTGSRSKGNDWIKIIEDNADMCLVEYHCDEILLAKFYIENPQNNKGNLAKIIRKDYYFLENEPTRDEHYLLNHVEKFLTNIPYLMDADAIFYDFIEGKFFKDSVDICKEKFPLNPQAGEMWWDGVSGKSFVYNSKEWVPASQGTLDLSGFY
jgi:hypothetical protein